jgi:hypothetical protein
MFGRKKEDEAAATQVDSGSEQNGYGDPLATIPKNKWERMWPVLACGSGLFSDGYINNVRFGSLRTTEQSTNTRYPGHWFRLDNAHHDLRNSLHRLQCEEERLSNYFRRNRLWPASIRIHE